MAAPKSVADIRDTFQLQLKKMQQLADDAAKAMRGEEQRPWMTPDKLEWSGDVTDIKTIAKAFDRKQNHEDFVKAISGQGVVGDLQVSQLQGDWLATAERSFRARHSGRVRASMHSASRLYGHGHAQGLFKKSILGYLQGIVQNSKNQPRTS